MKPPSELIITIPAAIVALPGLDLIERVVLHRINERPACANKDLAALTGLSMRGVESTLARLRQRGLVRSRGYGQARRLTLTFPVERHAECGESVSAKGHTKCGEAANAECHTNGGYQTDDLTSTKLLEEEISAMTDCLPFGNFAQARAHLDRLRQWHSALSEREPDKREAYDGCVQTLDDIVLAVEAGWEEFSKLSSDERGHFMKLLTGNSPERLREIRKEIMATKARGERVDLKRLLED